MSRIECIIGSQDDPIMTSRWIWQHPQWPSFTWDRAALADTMASASGAQGQLRMLSRMLDPGLTREALAEILKVEGISTSAIEGQYLNPASVAASVARHLHLPVDKDAPHSRDADGLIGVLMDATERFQEPLTEVRLCEWQRALFPESHSGLHQIAKGSLRPDEVVVSSGPIGRELIDFEAVPRIVLDENLGTFLDWFNSSEASESPAIRAGLAHLWLVTIHPFEDGNGRIARAVTDFALAQSEGRSDFLYRMSARIEAVKGEYYKALKQAQSFESGMDVTPWLGWFITQLHEACLVSERTIQRTLAKTAFWLRHREANLNERQRKVLNRLLDSGPGGFDGGMNARKYCAITKTSKPTATRDLADLVALGCLALRSGGGRSTSFDIPWDELRKP